MNWHCGNKNCPPDAGCSFSHSIGGNSVQKGWVFVDKMGIEVDPKIQMGNNLFKGKKFIKLRHNRNHALEKYYKTNKFPHEQQAVKAGRRRMLIKHRLQNRRLQSKRNLKFLINARSTYPIIAAAFGCVAQETGVFKNLQTSGVVGLGHKSNSVTQPPTLVEMMHKNKFIRSNNFALCFANEGGYMTFGGYNTTKHIPGEKPSVIKYNDNYKIKVNQIILHEESIDSKGKLKFKNKNILKEGFEGILDTGNSESSFPPKAFAAIKTQFDTYCAIDKDRCGGAQQLKENYCATYVQKRHGNLNTFFKLFPRIFFKLDNKTYVWFSYDYLYKDHSKSAKDGSTAVYCAGISIQQEDPKNAKTKIATLGVNFMRHYDWYFMKKTSKLSFTRSECDENMYGRNGVPIEGMRKYVKSTLDHFDKIST